jgi:hypothetical protein
MRSTCPSCLSQIEHPNSDTQVTCTFCNEIYSPFLAATDKQASLERNEVNFSESTLAFKEIVDFGHGLEQPSTPAPKVPMASPVTPNREIPEQPHTDLILSTADLGSDYRITQWFSPITKMVLLEEDRSPLETGFKLLKEAAKELGASAVIGIRCSLAPDNKRALLMGTPVQCRRNM